MVQGVFEVFGYTFCEDDLLCSEAGRWKGSACFGNAGYGDCAGWETGAAVVLGSVSDVDFSGVMASAISKKIVKPVNEIDLEHPEENQVYEELSPLLSKIHRQNREIQQQLELAKQQQEEFALITENMQEGLIVIDKYTMILSANSSAWNLFHVDKVCQGESVYCLDRAEDFRHAIEHVLSGEHAELVLKLNGNDIQLIANPVVRGAKTEVRLYCLWM